jgi:Transmembrane family 220, helix
MKAMLWTAANVIMLPLFLFSVALQYNDPDPIRWMSIYGISAVVCVLEIRRKTPLWLPALVALIAIVWAVSIGYGAHADAFRHMMDQWEMKNVHIEETREQYGLTIVYVWMLAEILAGVLRRRRGRPLATTP